jgi:hypothetical protein
MFSWLAFLADLDSGPAEIGGLAEATSPREFLLSSSLQLPNDTSVPSIELAAATWKHSCTKLEDDGLQRSFRHRAKARPETLAIELGPDAIPYPLQLRVYDPMARGSRTGCFARADGGIRAGVPGCGQLYEVDADNGSIGGCALRCWYVLTGMPLPVRTSHQLPLTGGS